MLSKFIFHVSISECKNMTENMIPIKLVITIEKQWINIVIF